MVEEMKCVECGAPAEGKPYCPDHIDRLPYVADLLLKIGQPLGDARPRRVWKRRPPMSGAARELRNERRRKRYAENAEHRAARLRGNRRYYERRKKKV